MTEKEVCLEDKIEDWRIVTRNHVRNINGVTKAHMIDMIDNVEKDVRKFIKKLKEKGKTRYKNPFGKPIYILTGEEINKLAGKKLSEVEK